MILETTRFGQIETADHEIFLFKNGLPGFEEHTRFILIQPNSELPFSFLQSVEDAALAFIVTDPFLFYETYEFEVTETQKEELEIIEPEDVAIRSIVTVKSELKDATANLRAPLVLNVRTKRGKQLVLHDCDYPTRYPLFPKDNEG